MYEDFEGLDYLGQDDDIYNDLLEMNLPEIPEEIQRQLMTTSVLNRFDYNLNSPLIADVPDSLLRAAQGITPRNRFRGNPAFDDKLASLQLVSHSLSCYSASTGFHQWAARAIFQKNLKDRNFRRVFDLRLPPAATTMQVVLDFWDAMTGTTPLPLHEALRTEYLMRDSKDPTISRLQDDGEAFWFFYQVVLMMNSSTTLERESLATSLTHYNVTLEKGSKESVFLFVGDHPDWGQFQVGPGFLVLPHQRRLLDRNMVLMLKDTMIARFASKFSQLVHPQRGVQIGKVALLTSLYTAGDHLMMQRGNDVYDVLQLVEPHCNQRLSDLAWKHRDRVPRDTRFQVFLSEEIIRLEAAGPGSVVPFFRLISEQASWEVVLMYYGVFRHWGHPFIDYLTGLKKLHDQVTLKKTVDQEYANALASDLAYIVLKHEFDRQKRWFVDLRYLDTKHPLYSHIRDCTWPTPGVVEAFGDHWHELPLTPCYEVPPSIDPAVLLADKSHSPNRSEVINWIRDHPNLPIPSKKVLKTALHTPQRNTKEYLTQINDEGLPRDSLVIGLKGKEREIKKNGRFFALMSWDLREYFVSTEYLIKTFFVPLFQGLTISDDLKSVTKKILNCTLGQGLSGYTSVTFANHLDYEKWNNHQRKEATDPVFRVMGQFLGLPELFTRTHEFFQKSLIYYGERPDLMEVRGDRVVPKGDYMVVWEGQDGGLEGLRQKGWSVLNLLVILREALVRNTKVQTLAQGDNQVICTQYKLPDGLPDHYLDFELEQIFANNAAIMAAIHKGTAKLGLIINQKETLVSSDYLTYGKVPVFRGCIQPHEVKRYSRITCIPNDQIPSIGNSISTVGTSSLTVAQFSSSLLGPMICYACFGYLVLSLHLFHSPLLQGPLRQYIPESSINAFFLRGLFLDPILGGISGTALTRFFIRQFPDPVSESLTFWKIVYDRSRCSEVKDVALMAGHPPVRQSSLRDLPKLLEKPVSLNLPKGLSAVTLVKSEVRKWLKMSQQDIKNDMIQEAVGHIETDEGFIKSYLMTIRPLFPRFLSEFASGSFLGLTESIVGLFQNSRTIRDTFSAKFRREVSELLIKSELIAAVTLGKPIRARYLSPWRCSAEKADNLRFLSWGSQVYGTTVPHPAEMVKRPTTGGALCEPCQSTFPKNEHLTVCFPGGLDLSSRQKGTLSPYLGSATSESTSLFQPWEKEVKLPLIERASKLRSAINWFVKPGSSVARAILENLRSLTGLDWEESNLEFSRTGSALHRFYSSRQSNGGFSAVSPSGPSWVVVTADTMPKIGTENYDFMYQSLMLYGQTLSLEINQYRETFQPRHHYHISCSTCLRRIEEISLESRHELVLPSRAAAVARLSGGVPATFVRMEGVGLRKGDWDLLSNSDRSFHIGVGVGANYSVRLVDGDPSRGRALLFPTSLGRKLLPLQFLIGLLQGLLMGASYDVVYRRMVMWKREPAQALTGCCYHLIDCLCKEESFVGMIGLQSFQAVLLSSSHRVPPSYPATTKDLGLLAKAFLDGHLLRRTNLTPHWSAKAQTLWIFSDFRTPRMTSLLILSHRLWGLLKVNKVSSAALEEIKAIKDLISYYSSRDKLCLIPTGTATPRVSAQVTGSAHVLWCGHEIRHAGRDIRATPIPRPIDPQWGQEHVCNSSWIELDFSTLKETLVITVEVPRHNDPLISGLRIVQLATGAHFKLRAILARTPTVRDGLVGGDGSGGMTAALLRMYPGARAIFNSLFVVQDRQLRGIAPGEPSALAAMPESVRVRCVNGSTAWKEASDLRKEETWTHFLALRDLHNMELSHMIFDMEVVDESSMEAIVSNLLVFIHRLLTSTGTLIFKLYGTRESATGARDLARLGSLFYKSFGVTTALTSSLSSEFYFVGIGLISGKIPAKHLTKSSFRRLLKSLPACADPEEEFRRAMRVVPSMLAEGVPPELMSDPLADLLSLITYFGLESGVSIKLVGLLRVHRGKQTIPIACFVSLILCLVSNSVIPLTKWFLSTYTPPSNQKLIRLVSCFVGCWEFLAWYYGRFVIRVRLSTFLDGPVIWSYREIIRETPKGPKPGVEWDWDEASWKSKRLPKPHEANLSGQLIRILARIWPSRIPGDYPSWDTFQSFLDIHLGLFNRGLHPLDTLLHSGVWFPGVGPRRVRADMWMAQVEEMAEMPEEPAPEDPEMGWES
uniref:Replicase n=1 Tax=Tongren Rhabd tick virus 3 TaxID=2972337 RepID=A0A9E7V2E6_9RHAB|nr:MAG: RNA-dependent RNA polymerase [Tongren Rhabd tick virus 3]